MADEIVGEHGQRMTIDLRLSEGNSPTSNHSHIGRLLTVDRIIRKPDEKQSLHEHYGAIAVDMESLAVAQVCQRERQRFLAIRAITDAVNDELPRDVERLLNRPTMARKYGAAAGSVFGAPRPSRIFGNCAKTASVAAERLAKFLVGVVQQLPD